jgi:hypothetical protein
MIGRFAAAWIGRLAATCLLVAAPAAGQTRVYTNADLGKLDPNWRGDTRGYWGYGVAPWYGAGHPSSADGFGMNRRPGGGRMYSLGEPRVTAPPPYTRPGSHRPPPPPAPRTQLTGSGAAAASRSRR